MKFRYLLAGVFISVLTFSSVIKTKAEEDICYFSNPKEYKDCYKNEKATKRSPSFPIIVGDGDVFSYRLKKECPKYNKNCLNIQKNNSLIRLKSKTGDELILIPGKPGNPLIPKSKSYKENIEGLTEIPAMNILSWSKDMTRYKYVAYQGLWHVLYRVSYLDEMLDNQDIYFLMIAEQKMWPYSPPEGNLISELISHISGLVEDEKRSSDYINNLISTKLNNSEKRLDIIRSIIKVKGSIDSECLIASETKYPDLVDKYKNLLNTINPLRAKLNLDPSNTIKPICN